MAYKYSKGSQVIGDLSGSDDSNRDTAIDFEEDYIALQTSGSARLVVSGSDGKVGIGIPNPIKNPNSRSCFTEIELFIINPIQISFSNFHRSLFLVVHFLKGFDFGEQVRPSRSS